MLNNELQKNIKVDPTLQLSLVLLRGNKFLLLKNYNKYFLLPSKISCTVKKDFLVLEAENKDAYALMLLVYNSMSNYLKSLLNPVKRTLKLKGLGFRINIIKDLNIIEFKLGFSHLKRIKIPSDEINAMVQKNTLFLEGRDTVLMGNFLNKIRSLKIPDIYKGKGFWYKYQKECFKVIKKK
jgi:ribosomal protein L6P/L9E